MSVIPKLSSVQGRKDDEPNKALGRELAESRDVDAIREIAENLQNDDERIRMDCLSVLEQVGRLAPELIAEYASDFMGLLQSRNNQLVWASMINLALVAERKAPAIFERRDELLRVIKRGSVITQDNGIKVLARVAASDPVYHQVLWPFLLETLEMCRSKSVGQYAESISVAATPDVRAQYLDVLNKRLPALSDAQQKRVRKLLRVSGGA